MIWFLGDGGCYTFMFIYSQRTEVIFISVIFGGIQAQKVCPVNHHKKQMV